MKNIDAHDTWKVLIFEKYHSINTFQVSINITNQYCSSIKLPFKYYYFEVLLLLKYQHFKSNSTFHPSIEVLEKYYTFDTRKVLLVFIPGKY